MTDVSQILIRSGRNMGLSYAEEIVSISSAFERILMHERDRQTVTDRQTDKQTAHGTVTSIPIGEIALRTLEIVDDEKLALESTRECNASSF